MFCRDHGPIVMIAQIMAVQPHDRFLDGVPPSGSGAVPPGDLGAVRPHAPAGASWLVLPIRIAGQDLRFRDGTRGDTPQAVARMQTLTGSPSQDPHNCDPWERSQLATVAQLCGSC